MNKWDAKFGFFWYNDDEIFNYSKEDFEEKARKMAESGINIVMTFSCTHFRWCMKEHWPLINKCLKNVVDACHKYGIKVVEHHSSHLTWDPLDEEDWDYMERVLNKRFSSISSWEGIRKYVDGNTIKGTENYRQIDGRTGKWARSNYKGWCKCFNNEEYRTAYFNYLEELYSFTGVDGIMTDDVQFFGEGHACSCGYCKKLFKENYGYSLPDPGEDWETFYGDYNNPIYIAWEKFRRDSTLRFQNDVNRHFTGLGLNMLRPNYVSGAITNNWSAYPFEKALDLWDWVFQENCFSFVIKHSWPQFLTESHHRYNMGRLKSIPSMSMFYPDRYDSFYFTWALSMSWGQMFTATPEGEDMTETEKVFRDFEKKHTDLLFNQQKRSDITIYWSYETANLCNPAICNHISSVKSWTQALTFAGYSTDMVFASEKEIDNDTHKCILIPDAMMMSDDEYEKINRFAENGGTVIYTGRPGVKKSDGTYRTVEEMQQGLKMPENPDASGVTTEYNLGLGRVIMYSETDLDDCFYNPHSVDRWKNTAVKKRIPEYKAPEMAEAALKLLDTYADRMITVKSETELLNSYFTYDSDYNNILIHLINAEATINTTEPEEGHNDIIPAFTINAQKNIMAEIIVKKTDIERAYLLSIELPCEVELKTTLDKDKTLIEIPAGLISGYGIIRIPV